MRGISSSNLLDKNSRWLTIGDGENPPAQALLRQLLDCSLVLTDNWENLPATTQAEMTQCADTELLLPLLVQHGLLTHYQAQCVDSGKAVDLVLGNYRVLDRLGSGGMGVVFKGEHVDLRRPVAIKILPLSVDLDDRVHKRFLTEMRVLAQLQHPNIVAAMDAGTVPSPEKGTALLRYFVMEYVPGMDLDEYVQTQGPLSLSLACDTIYQIAGALGEAHKHNLVHRDIKPSNIRLTPRGQAKLLDFGLARHLPSRMTDPGTLLGSMDYISPEQASDAGTVDIRSDIYGLGGTMFWCLTGRPPFVCQEGILQQVACRLTQQPPSVRSLRPDLPTRVEDILVRMLATKPEDRYPTPQAVMEALEPYVELAKPNQVRPASAGQPPVKTPESVDLVTARIAMVQGLAKLVQFREGESEAHLIRLERYCRCLAEEAGAGPDFAGKIDSEFIDQLLCCAPLHDIGKVGLPDHILMKPGKLDADERILMQTHTIIGADLLQAMARQYGSPLALLQMAPQIARHHHERFDGKGYPDQLAGTDIPLAARMVNICDVYDALRSRRTYKPALFHSAALQVMTDTCRGQFDPSLLQAFLKCARQFEKIFKDFPE